MAYDCDERLVGAFGNWPEGALHLVTLDTASHALREEEAESEPS
jgi:hypothetical protein